MAGRGSHTEQGTQVQGHLLSQRVPTGARRVGMQTERQHQAAVQGRAGGVCWAGSELVPSVPRDLEGPWRPHRTCWGGSG